MGLKWFLNSAFTQVLGHSDKRSNPKVRHGFKNLEHEDEDDSQFGHGVTIKNAEFPSGFQMPLHYPRYTKEDYEKMEEERLDLLLKQYGICFFGTLEEKRAYAIGAFLWPDQF